MGSTSLERLLRRISPDAVTRSYLAKFAVVMLVVVAAIGAVGAVTYAQTTDHLESNAQDDYTAVAELSATEFDVWAGDHRATARNLADNGAFARDPEEAEAYLSSQLAWQADDIVALHYVDRESGASIASTSDPERADALTDRNWFDADLLSGDDVYVSPTYEVDEERRVAYVVQTPTREYFVMEVDVASAIGEFRQPTAGSFTTLVEGDGTIGASDRDGIGGAAYDEEIRSAIVEGTSIGHVSAASFEFTDESEYFVAYAPVPSESWYVAVHVPLSEAYALSADIARNLLLIVGVANSTGSPARPTRSSPATSMSRSKPIAATSSANCTARSRRCETRSASRSNRRRRNGSERRPLKPRARRSPRA